MKIVDITKYLERLAPRALQESYDNSGLLVGNPQMEVKKALVSLDMTEAVVQEAIEQECELVIAHHPIIFGGLKSLTGKNHVERTVLKAIRNDIALYAIHTNLDNIQQGVNAKIGEKLGIQSPKILQTKRGLLKKLVVFVPHHAFDEVQQALFDAGAGALGNYTECSFQSVGEGNFKGDESSNPSEGEAGKRSYVSEARLEVLVHAHQLESVLSAMYETHPYEEVAHDIYALENEHHEIGSGMYGYLNEPMYIMDFLKKVKDQFGGIVRYTAPVYDKVEKIAWCGGSGSFLLNQAKSVDAQVFLSSDFKYHQFFDAESNLIIADIGHYENEQYTKELIAEKLKEKFPTFAVLLADTNTNPINYL